MLTNTIGLSRHNPVNSREASILGLVLGTGTMKVNKAETSPCSCRLIGENPKRTSEGQGSI